MHVTSENNRFIKKESTLYSKWFKPALRTSLVFFLMLNMLTIFHAYRFTHFVEHALEKTHDPKGLTAIQKINTMILGVKNPRPENTSTPTGKYETIVLHSNHEIECWSCKTENAKGTIMLLHGYGGCKSDMLDKADVFLQLGYNAFLIDFMGSGGSEGRQTTIGFMEAEQVRTGFEYLRKQGEKNIYIFGTSMGAAAAMKAINDYAIQPRAIILECPFGSIYQTVCARFRMMQIPEMPLAGLLVFWGGLINGFWAFSHQPEVYAGKITCPSLLLYGARDEKVSREEIDRIFQNLKGQRTFIEYKQAGHENYLSKVRKTWINDVRSFLKLNE